MYFLVSATTTSKGLKVGASLDRNVYEKDVRVTGEEMEQLDLRVARTLGPWNYVIRPRSKEVLYQLFMYKSLVELN